VNGRQFLANVRTNLVFYRRNRILVLFGLVTVLVLVISLVSFAFTASKKFDLLHNVISMVEGFCFVFAAILGLLSVSHHVRNRSVKLVATKPFPLGGWVLSHLVSMLVVVVVVHLLILVVSFVMFAVWGMPFQWGLLVEMGSNILACTTIFAFLLLLSTIVHPVVAGLIALIFSPSSVHGMLTMLEVPRRFAEGGVLGAFYDAVAWFLTGLYYLLPEYFPFAGDLQTVFNTYRVTRFDVPYLVLTVMYTPIVTALCLFLTTAILCRKRLI
jgi:ABC-type transport system involved in multi-copper enzyme maturation permease subunit